jgi:hypothetical protein
MPKTTQSALYQSQLAAGGNVVNRINDGRVTAASPQYTRVVVNFDGSNVANDVITLFELPAGSYVLPELSKIIVTDDMTSGALNVHVGDVADPDRYCISANCAAPGVVDFIAAGATAFPAGLLTRTDAVKSATAAKNTVLVTATLATFTATIEAGQFVVILAYASI